MVRKRTLLLFGLILLLSGPAFTQPSGLQQDTTLKIDTGETYSAWLPPDFGSHHHDVPLILFSHGFGGCAQQSRTLTQSLANAGYLVLAPNHVDKACERYISGLLGGIAAFITGRGPDKSFGDDQQWTDTTEEDRRNDVENLLSYALTHQPYEDAVDPKQVALMGHSLGGYTVLGIAGGWDRWKDPRIKAVLAMAPYSAPFNDHQTLSSIKIPMMYFAGSKDDLISADLVRKSFDLSKGEKYLVVLKGAGHFAYTELDKTYQATIAACATGFFDHVFHRRTNVLTSCAQSPQVEDFEPR